jgi:hypothetical protein
MWIVKSEEYGDRESGQSKYESQAKGLNAWGTTFASSRAYTTCTIFFQKNKYLNS